jgi:hypothetical protein
MIALHLKPETSAKVSKNPWLLFPLPSVGGG